MGMREKKRSQRRVLARRTAAPPAPARARTSCRWKQGRGRGFARRSRRTTPPLSTLATSPTVSSRTRCKDSFSSLELLRGLGSPVTARWKGVRGGFVPIDRVAIERKRHNKDKTIEEHKKMAEGIVKRDEKRRKRIKASGIDYECPALVGSIQPWAKKIKFGED